MAMERVTVEQNGERFTLEVPEGTSDEEITSFLAQQQQQSSEVTQTEPNPAENIGTYAAQAVLPAAIGGPDYVANQALRNAQAGMINAKMMPGPMPNMTQAVKPGVVPSAAAEMAKRLYSLKDLSLSGVLTDIGGTATNQGRGITGTLTDAAKFVTEPLGGRMTLGQAATALPKAVAAGVMAPENLFTLPYNMAAYEQEKIRANPTAPQYKTTPYAQAYRGEFPTQGAAAASNRRDAIRSQQYGGLSSEEQQMLKQDRELSYAMRLQAAKKVLGQQ